ncbi:DnaA ATPase domain-containing protein [Thiorhodovibrio frisius]|uniref:ATPase involved in DNA replication initiation n=1 Tax=Thiorhodovibrio frisius TaxID=631362 RepID=H8Z653_9GAMM|nr:DnaA/Hda family protein [Thiorhodovibrio frisius]EIC19620.1 ATPase involved in DNA replication initiation [Thiorhodovibrio frisius]WPL20414.1 Chromosomal replication initiator protein DnaA [Thiorhodovibrio frisius]
MMNRRHCLQRLGTAGLGSAWPVIAGMPAPERLATWVDGKAAAERHSERAHSLAPEDAFHLAKLIPEFRFETFVRGQSNAAAWEACQRIAGDPASAHGALYLQGGQGLGKSHLMNAIGYQVLAQNPRAKVRFVHSERFAFELRQLREAGQPGQIETGLDQYRNLDLLLFDDPGFLSNKPSAQSVFAHVFQTLLERGKTLVFSDERFMAMVPGINHRLRDLFSQSVEISVAAPDLETRLAILRHRAAWWKIELPEGVAMDLATSCPTNVRELEGALRRLMAESRYVGIPIDPRMARRVLRDFSPLANAVT